MNAIYCITMLALPMSMMIVSDFRCRSVNSVWIVCLFMASVTAAVLRYGFVEMVVNVCVNSGLILYMALCAWGYYRVKMGVSVNLLKNYLGVGDLLFLVCLTPLFDFYGYLFFLISSFVVTLVGWWGYKLLCRNQVQSIPLVSTVGIVFLIYMSIKLLTDE